MSIYHGTSLKNVRPRGIFAAGAVSAALLAVLV